MTDVLAQRARRSVLRAGGLLSLIAGVATAVPAVVTAAHATGGPAGIAPAAAAVRPVIPVQAGAASREHPAALRAATTTTTPHLARGGVRPGHDGPGSATCSDSVVSASLMPFSEHVNHAHLERSPEQQVSDIQATGAYVSVHVALIEAMAKPVVGAAGTVPEDSLTPFIQHMKYAHIERPLQQQVSDAEATDDYVKLHTVLIEHVTEPGRTALIGDC